MPSAIHAIDAVIVVCYLIAVVIFGLWIGRGQKDLAGYLLGGRDLPWWAVMGSIVATETSTATFLSVPGLAYAQGGDMRFLQLAAGFVLGRLIVVAFLLPQYFRGQLFSAYEVLERRFGPDAKRGASLMFLAARNLGDGLRLFLTGIVLEKVAGINLTASIIVIGVATIVYTFFGGMKAIVWNDCVQFVVYVGGGILAGVMILQGIPGGWEGFREFALENGKFRVLDFRWNLTDPFTIWAGLIGGATLTLGTHGTDQMMVQRYLSARNQRDAGTALIGSGFVVLLQFTLFLLLGAALASFYSHHPPARPFGRTDEVFATFIVTQMPVGLIGVTLAAVFSAAMSTLSSSLNSSASAAVNDLYLPLSGGKPDSPYALRMSRWFTIAFGAVQIVVGIAASELSRSVVNDALAIAGFTAGVLLGMFALGVLTRTATEFGVLAGMLAGLLLLTLVKFATAVAWPWYPVIGAAATFAAGWLASQLASPPRPPVARP